MEVGPARTVHATKMFSENASSVVVGSTTLNDNAPVLQLGDRCEGYMMGQVLLTPLWSPMRPTRVSLVIYQDKNAVEWPPGFGLAEVCAPLLVKVQNLSYVEFWNRELADMVPLADIEEKLAAEVLKGFQHGQGDVGKVADPEEVPGSDEEEELAAIESLL